MKKYVRVKCPKCGQSWIENLESKKNNQNCISELKVDNTKKTINKLEED